MTDRLEARTEHTRACPDDSHSHVWRRGAQKVWLVATERGEVSVSEEALAALLTEAGYHPDADSGRPRSLVDQHLVSRVAELRAEHGPIGLDLDEGPADV